jgi:hypothetical protein
MMFFKHYHHLRVPDKLQVLKQLPTWGVLNGLPLSLNVQETAGFLKELEAIVT